MMTNVYIKKVWGKADNFDIALTPVNNNEWQTSLPPDLIDGWYAILLYAEDSKGRIGTWHGVLYIADGFSHLHIEDENFSFWLLPETNLKFVSRQVDRFGYELIPQREIELKERPPRIELILIEECEYHGS